MQLSAETIDAYSIAILSSSYYSHLLSQSVIIWPIILVLFTLPSLNLLINLGYVSGYGQILTFQRISPISSGISFKNTNFLIFDCLDFMGFVVIPTSRMA